MEEEPTSTGAEQPAAPIPPTASRADTGDTGPENTATGSTAAGNTATGNTASGRGDRMPRTHEEWTAFAALPPTERAEVYIRALRSMTAVVATLAVAGPVAVVILALPAIRGFAHDWRPAVMAQSGR